MKYTNHCCAEHTVTIRGFFATWRNARWWRKHADCPCVDYKFW